MLSTFFLLPANAQRRGLGLNADGDLLGGSNSSSGGGSTVDRENGWGVAINLGYESPDKDLRDYYKAAPTFGLTVIKRLNNWRFSGSADYRSYKPKQDVFVTESDYGNAYTAFSNFRGIGLYAGIAYSLPITDAVEIYGGINAGSVFISQSFYTEDDAGNQFSFSGNSSLNYLGPKLGFNFASAGNITIGIEGRYGLNLTGFNSNTQTGTEVYKGFSAVSANLMLTYNF
ncbi:hypothetical protein FPZ42_01400 [Mucilaginibacter achroorhodeus]|uniref:Outer membrane protein beta-barrel domain-containing protein n=1 Tax=Mucilaginibacter achroorhodeus TaxID=2599294 RepID=A0A563U984_9SPHI|nr:hypothetical protein [Mucilaginibacter achroorhodeus]TWR27898.1 hypothetical protein FPZ42_01400 [Mucilaginibacter achroorhodeus]